MRHGSYRDRRSLGDVVGVAGKPAKSRRGEPSLAVDELTGLAPNRSPLPDTFHGLTDTETRYRKRYLDLLMNEESRALFLLRTKVVSSICRYLDSEGFVEVETPVLQPLWGAFAHPFVTHSNELDTDLYLRIATELYLKRLIVGGLERVYEIGKDFRNESVSYKHQPEFTMPRVVRGVRRLPRHDGPHRRDARAGRVRRTRNHRRDVSRARDRSETSVETHRLRRVTRDARAWTRDEDELRAWLTERGVDTEADKDWPQLVDHAFGHFVEPSLVEPTIVHASRGALPVRARD